MAKPWEKYAAPAQAGPWSKYAQPAEATTADAEAQSIAKQQEAMAAAYTGTGTDQFGGQAPQQPNPSLFRMDSDFRERAGVGHGDMLWAAAKDMFGSRQGAAEYLAKESGGTVGAGDNGDPTLALPDGTAYRLNDPGLDTTDAANVAGNVAAFMTPAGWATRAARARNVGTLGRAAMQGGALAATDAGMQTAFNDGNIDAGRTALVGLSGAGGELVAGGLRGLAGRVGQGLDPIRQRAVEFAQQQNIPLHISQLSQSVPVKALASTAKYLPFSGAGKAGARQQEAFNRAVSRTFGADAPQLSDDVTRGARKNLSGQFEDIYSRNNVPLGEAGLRRLNDVERGTAMRLTKDEAQVVRNQMDSILGELDDMGAMTGQKYQALRSQIMKAEGPDKVGQAVGELRKALDDIAADAVGPEDAARLKQIRGQWANLRTAENMLKQVAGAGGDVKPSAIWPAIRKGSTREMRELGRLGQTVLKDPIPDSGTPGRLLSLGLLGGGGMTGGVGALPTIGAMVAGGATVGRALNSPAAANLLLRGRSAAPSSLQALARVASGSGVALAPLMGKKERRLKDGNGK